MGGLTLLVEGLDLAGKSSLMPRLARFFEGEGLKVRVSRNSLCPENPVAREADEMRQDPERDPERIAQLFVAAHMWDAAHFRPPVTGEVHLQDSCWLRTLAWEEWHGRRHLAELVRLAARGFPRFQAALYLTVSLRERQRRFYTRAHNDCEDRMVLESPREFSRLESCLRREAERCAGATVMDTTALTHDQVLERAARFFSVCSIAS